MLFNFFLSIQNQIFHKAEIGNNVTVLHLVTIGVNEKKYKKEILRCVEFGGNCYISCGAKIISAKLSDNVKIGPNFLVSYDVSYGKVVVHSVNNVIG